MANTKTTTKKARRANGEGGLWTDPKDGKLYARIFVTTIHPVTGEPKRAPKLRRAQNRTHGFELIQALKEEFKTGGVAGIEGARVTFAELGEYHKTRDLVPVVRNSAGVRIKGLATWAERRRIADRLVAYFGGGKLIQTLTVADVRRFKTDRACAPLLTSYHEAGELVLKIRLDKNGKPKERKIRSVHIELAALRRMLNVAVELGWLPRGNPAAGKTKLINPKEEEEREYILTIEEEEALLAACDTHYRRRWLKPYLMTLLDTGARSIELRRLVVADLNFDDVDGIFNVYSDKGTQRHWRELVMTPRVREALLECCHDKAPGDPVFHYGKPKIVDGKKVYQARAASPKSAFNTLKREVKFWSDNDLDIDRVRPHDARHTMITRAIAEGHPLAEVAKYAGHRNPATTWRYINPSQESRRSIARSMAKVTSAPPPVPVATIAGHKAAKVATKKTTRKSKAA